MNMSGGVISGNWTNNSSSAEDDLQNYAYDGGGVYVNNGGTLNLSGGYITNNYKSLTDENDSYDRHGGGGVAIDHGSTMNMTGGYVTGNQSEDAAGGIFAGYRGNSNFSMTGGIIASNFANHGEGGGLRVGGGTNAIIDASSVPMQLLMPPPAVKSILPTTKPMIIKTGAAAESLFSSMVI